MDAAKVVQQLLSALPDSYHDDHCWQWCWSELDEDAQLQVKQARRAGLDYLAEATGKEQE